MIKKNVLYPTITKIVIENTRTRENIGIHISFLSISQGESSYLRSYTTFIMLMFLTRNCFTYESIMLTSLTSKHKLYLN